MHTAVQEDFIYTPDPIVQSCSLEADALLLSTVRAGEEEEDEPSTENNVKSSKRGAHIALHEIILHLWHLILLT